MLNSVQHLSDTEPLASGSASKKILKQVQDDIKINHTTFSIFASCLKL
jgi:hypothetical protein